MSIQALRRQWEAGEQAEVLGELVKRWRACRHPLLAELIQELEPARPAGTGANGHRELRRAWRQGDPLSIGRTVAQLFEVGPERALALWRREAAWRDDPRVVQALLEGLRTQPPGFRGPASLAFWGEVLRWLAQADDPRVQPILDELATAFGPDHRLAPLFRAHTCPAARPQALQEASTVERWLATLRTDDVADLVASVYASPGDLDLRAVLSDRLVQVGDPRGEAIALELAGRSADRLNRLHGHSWLGAIAPMVQGTRFRLGFVDRARLRARARLDTGLPEWRTLRSLDLGSHRSLGPFLHTLPLLEEVKGGETDELPRHLHALSVELPHAAALALLGSDDWPQLRDLTLQNRGEPTVLRVPGPICVPLERLRLSGYTVDAAVHDWPGTFELHLAGPWQRTLLRDADGRLSQLEVALPYGRDAAALGELAQVLDGLDPTRLVLIRVRLGRNAASQVQRDIGRQALRTRAPSAEVVFG